MPQQFSTPEDDACESDPGDETFRRYRYQSTYTAILATSLKDADSEYEYLYCEHHEDILLKRVCGDFCGVQVKTRDEGYEPFKSNEAQILGALKRFVLLEQKYPGQFFRFVIATNSGFWCAQQNGSNLGCLLDQARACVKENSPASTLLLSYARRLKPSSSTADGLVINVLSRVELQAGLPHLDGIEERLIRHLSALPITKGSCYSTLQSAASALTDRISRAASKACESHLKDYAAIMVNPDETATRIVISSKKITHEDITAIINKAVEAVSLLRSANEINVSSLPAGFSKLEIKMTKGAIDVDNLDVFKDMKASAESNLIQRLYKNGAERTNSEYGHIQTMVKLDCREAFDATKNTDEPFGLRMLQEVRSRLRLRTQVDAASLLGLKYEHLLGVAAILTEDCTLWWSERFNLDAEVST